MKRTTHRRRPLAVVAALAVTLLGAFLTPIGTATADTTTNLTGTLLLDQGKESNGSYSGSYFRMILPGGTDQYFTNPNSLAPDKTYTLFVPGTDGGLQLGRFQEPPNPAFNNGDALANRIVQPNKFAGIYFSISTAPVDAQNGQPDVVPQLTLHSDNTLTGNLNAWTAGWNSIYFNQGSPKPDGTFPGFTRPVTGTYDPKTHGFEIVWYSLIVGGPFNGFTGYWHLQGKVGTSASPSIATTRSKVSVRKGTTAKIAATVTNPTSTALPKSSVRVAAPKGLALAARSKKFAVSPLAAGASRPLTLKLKVGARAKPGAYKVKLTWLAAGQKRSTVVTVTVKK